MQNTPITLPGLEHLISVLKAHGIGVDLQPPSPAAPRAGDLVLGEPFDPILAAIYAHFDGGRFGDFHLYPTKHPDGGVVQLNADLRHPAEVRLHRLFRFGAMGGFAYYFATLPSFPGPGGIQPVVYLSDYVIKLILPIASNVDRAFELYARYCETRLTAYGALEGEPRGDHDEVDFPDGLVDDIARDRELVRVLQDPCYTKHFVVDPEEQRFTEKILKAARDQA